MGRTLQDIISGWIGKLNNREIDRTRMPLNLAEMITVGTHVCKVGSCLCFLNLPRTSEILDDNSILT
ncbi:hypothetical protein BDE02_19G002400 [Populus trichocarpa]|nr:hypothetical protein BDE02_19G002400 [Populus trichocarpa]KAI5554305.1 hypothetical protein BDE02_19G002400 [Populus trichocarpa]KAI5554306.1 hypothetical protein BDE02_19G002400 [Populus trichocarpa]